MATETPARNARDARLRATSDVSVIIPTYTERRREFLARTIASVRAQTRAPLEIIVVVDRNERLLGQLRDLLPGVLCVANRHWPGAGGARHTGALESHGSVLAFLDDDVVADSDWIERLEQVLSDPGAIGAGGTVAPGWFTGRPRWFPPEFDWVVGCTYVGLPTHVARVRNVQGGNMAVRRSAFFAAGGFSHELGNVQAAPEIAGRRRPAFVTRASGCEDTEFCIRATQCDPDRYWVFDPSMRVRHHIPTSRSTLRYFLSRCTDEGLAKARVVVANVGPKHGLSDERRYVSRTLPLGVMRGLEDVVVARDPWGPARAAAIVAGVGVTTAGYVWGRLGASRRSAPASVGVARGR